MSKRKNTFTRFIEDIVDDTKDFVDDILDRAKDLETDMKDAVKDVVDDDEDDSGPSPASRRSSPLWPSSPPRSTSWPSSARRRQRSGPQARRCRCLGTSIALDRRPSPGERFPAQAPRRAWAEPRPETFTAVGPLTEYRLLMP